MTWDEFKAEIDRQLQEQGHDGSAEIWYIDISFPSMDHESTRPSAYVDDIHGLQVA